MLKVIFTGYCVAALLSAGLTLVFDWSLWLGLLVFWLSGSFTTLGVAQISRMRIGERHRAKRFKQDAGGYGT